MSDFLEISNLTKIYPTPTGAAVIVKDFNLRIRRGEFVCLIGHSGCGKSTVLSMIAGLNELSGGGIILAGKELVERIEHRESDRWFRRIPLCSMRATPSDRL